LLAKFKIKINIIHEIPYCMKFQKVKNPIHKNHLGKPKYDPKKNFHLDTKWFPNGNARGLLSIKNEII